MWKNPENKPCAVPLWGVTQDGERVIIAQCELQRFHEKDEHLGRICGGSDDGRPVAWQRNRISEGSTP